MSDGPLKHPTAEELRALSLGQLSEAELARISAHLGECAECCGILDQLGAADPLVARLQESASHRTEILVTPAQRRSAVRALRDGQEGRADSRSRDSQAAPVILPVPRQVGDYDILAEVGRGGMGVVYKARHRSLHRLAALKMVLAGEFASSTQELRFRLEAELAARVKHPNIVQVYEIGTHEGRPFLALEWVEGGSLANRLDGKPWPPREAARLIETLARAIHVAHAEGVVHRDLKPANILLQKGECRRTTDEGEPSHSESMPSSIIPKITDFGLAQPTEGGMILTQSGSLVGTPGYMAPEQAGGKRTLVGPATDTYALGVVLYQLLTGQLPFEGDSTMEVLRAVMSNEPARPRRLQPRLPRDLEAITLHCLEKEPTRRYPSALALAEDLQRFREGKQVAARPAGAVARLARACRRRPLVASLFTLLAVSLLGGLAGVTWKWLEANEQRDQANTEKQAALYQVYRAELAAAGAALQNHDIVDADRHLRAAPAALRDWEWRHFNSRLDDSVSVIPLPAGGIGLLLPGSDRLRLGTWTTAGLLLTDLEGPTPKTLPLEPERGPYVHATQTRRGLRIVRTVGNKTLELLDEMGRVLCRAQGPQDDQLGLVTVSPDGARLACVERDGDRRRLLVFDATSGKQTAVCAGHPGVRKLAFSPDGTRLASGSEDKTVRLWDTATGRLLATCEGHTSRIQDLAFRPDGARLVTTSSDETVRQWNAETGEEVEAPYDRHTGEVAAAVYSPDGQWVASAGGVDRTVRVWRATGRQDVAILHGHTGAVVAVAFNKDGHRLASLSCESKIGLAPDDTVRVWDVDPQATLPVLRGHTRTIYPVAFSPDSRWIASGSWDTKVFLWDAATGELCGTLPHLGIVWTLTFGPDGSWLVSGTNDDRVRIWDLATGRVRKEIPVSPGFLRFVTVSPDGKRVAATAFDPQTKKHHLQVRDIATGEKLFAAVGWSLAYSPDGSWLAILAADDKTVLLLDARTHETAARLIGHEQFVRAATFSPDSSRLASCSLDHTIRVWQTDPLSLPPSRGKGGDVSVTKCQELRGHTGEVFSIAFHSDGTRLASGGRDRAVWLWDLARGEEVARLQGHTSFVWSLAFSPDGATLVSGSGDATVRLWDTAPLQNRYQARRKAAALRPKAERLVEQLWQQKNDPAKVVQALRADAMLEEPLRHAALRAVMRRTLPQEAAPGNPHDGQ
jgi:WD40 repeat protein/tRNA A-37 threonylcarbamoyl transferase component Bud32